MTTVSTKEKQDIQLVPYDPEQFTLGLIEYLKSYMPDSYKDFIESNAARPILEAIGTELGMLAYMINVNAKEHYIPTAATRKAMWMLGQLVNYSLSPAVSSGVVVRFYLNSPINNDVSIPAGTQVQASGTTPIIFETTETVSITAGQTEVEVDATQGKTVTEVLGRTNSEPRQSLKSTKKGLSTTASLWVGDIPWKRFSLIYDMEEGEHGFVSKTDYEGYCLFQFGDGTFGLIPQEGQSVTVQYRTSEGADGNVTSGSINEILSTIVDSRGQEVDILVTNDEPASGGHDEESVNAARINIPRSVRAISGLISEEDFTNMSSLFESDTYGKIYKSKSTVTYTWTEHLITIYVLTTNNKGIPTQPSQDMLDEVKTWAEEKTLPSVGLITKPATIVGVTIRGTVHYDSSYRINMMEYRINRALDDIFHYDLREIGDPIYLSDIYKHIGSKQGVLWFDLEEPADDVIAADNEFLVEHVDTDITFVEENV